MQSKELEIVGQRPPLLGLGEAKPHTLESPDWLLIGLQPGSQPPAGGGDGDKEVFAAHGQLSECYAVQDDASEAFASAAGAREPSDDSGDAAWAEAAGLRPRPRQAGDAAAAAAALAAAAGALPAKRAERSERVGLPPVDPVRSLLQQAREMVRGSL